MVEADVVAVQVERTLGGNARHQFLGGDAFALGLQHDGGAVGIVRAHEQHLLALHALEAHPDVGLDVFHDVADVEGTVGVGQCRGNEQALGLLAGGGLGLGHGGRRLVEERREGRFDGAGCPARRGRPGSERGVAHGADRIRQDVTLVQRAWMTGHSAFCPCRGHDGSLSSRRTN